MTKLRGVRWWMMGLLMIGSIINYLTRSTLAVAAPTVLKDLDITTQQYSWIASGFQVAIMLQPICGYVMDTIGLKLGFAIFATAWSFICMATRPGRQLADAVWPARAPRICRGLGESGGDEGDLGMVSGERAWPCRRVLQHGRVARVDARGTARRVGDSDAQLAVRLRPYRSDWPRLGRALAGVLSAAGEASRRCRPAERDYIVAGQETHLAGAGRPAITTLLRERNFWGIAIPRFLADPTWGTLTFWLPLYLTTVRGFDLKQIALFAWLPFLAADLGCLFGGTISLTLQKYAGVRLIDARRSAFTVGALMMMGVAFAGTVQNPYVAVGLLSLAGFAHQTLSVTVITMASDLFKRNEVATVAGMAGTCGNAGVLILYLLMGALVARIGYTPFFISLAALDMLGAIVLWTVVRNAAP